MLSDRAVTFVAVVITTVWAILSVLDAAVGAYQTPAAVHGIMGLVAGALFGERAVRHYTGKRDSDDG